MRKHIIFSAAALAFAACEKGENLQKPAQQGGAVKSKATLEERYEDYTPPGEVEPTIQNFISAVENQTVDPMPLNEAVWKVEAGLNYEHRHQLFSYTESTYDTLSYEVDMNGDLVNATSLIQVYESVVDDPTGGVGHFVFGDVRGYYTPSTDKGTLQVFVKVAYDKNPWDDRDITVEERKVALAEDCSDPPMSKPNTGYELVAKKALAKYLNQMSYNPNLYYHHTLVDITVPSDKYAGGRNALFPNHRGSTNQGISPGTCISKNEMASYRDFIFGQLYNLNKDVVDLKLVWDMCYFQSTSTNDAKWGYTNCPSKAKGYVKTGISTVGPSLGG
jgi:hypothetical protein